MRALRRVAPLAVISLLLLGANTAFAKPPTLSPEEPPRENVEADKNSEIDSVHAVDQYGFRAYHGEPSPELARLSDEISEWIAEHETTYAGSAFLADYSGLEVYRKHGENTTDSQLNDIIQASHAGDQVRIIEVNHSLAELQTAIEEMALTSVNRPEILNLGISAVDNTIRVKLDPKMVEDADLNVIASDIQDTLSHLQERAATPIIPIVKYADLPVGTTEATRTNDSSPFYMGGRIVPVNGAQTACSLGVPMTLNGTFMVLTAGHCTAPSWKNPNGNFVGSVYTTAYNPNPALSNTHRFGDWKLLRGRNYAMRVFSAGMQSSASLPISGGTWAPRAEGAELCKSGGTTGSHCRLVVLDTRQIQTLGTHRSAYTTRVRYDPDRNGSYVCGATAGGDSGGTYYYADGNGGVIAYGIHRGRTYNGTSPQTNCIYHAVELAGVRAWAPNIWVN